MHPIILLAILPISVYVSAISWPLPLTFISTRFLAFLLYHLYCYRRQEVLYCNVICPITIPNMIVSTAEEGSVLNFGAVAIGTKARKWVHVHNTSGHTIFVNRTILDTNGLFYCPFTISRFDVSPR